MELLETVGTYLLDGLAGRPHVIPVERRDDAQATAVDVLLAEPLRAKPILDEVHQVALLAAVLVDLGDLGELRQLAAELRRSSLAEVARLRHAVQHVAVPVEQFRTVALADSWVKGAWRVQHRGEHGPLLGREILRVAVEVRLGGRLDAVGTATVVDRGEACEVRRRRPRTTPRDGSSRSFGTPQGHRYGSHRARGPSSRSRPGT